MRRFLFSLARFFALVNCGVGFGFLFGGVALKALEVADGLTPFVIVSVFLFTTGLLLGYVAGDAPEKKPRHKSTAPRNNARNAAQRAECGRDCAGR